MSYFRELPDIEYQSPLSDRNSSLDYVRVKNLFRRVKLRDDLKNIFTLFNKYEIKEGARPDSVAEELYNKADYDWVVLISAGIVNVRDEWPLSNYHLYNYALEKYGGEINATKHYETKEIKDDSGRVILPAGKVVDSDFTILNLTPSQVVVPVTNYEYEVRKNEEKRSIYVLKPEYVGVFVADIKRIMTYDESSQYVDSKLIRTTNSRIKSP
jgi:hypothetical protein